MVDVGNEGDFGSVQSRLSKRDVSGCGLCMNTPFALTTFELKFDIIDGI